GDTTPSAKFHVNTTDNTVARFESSDNNMNFVLADDDKEWVQGIDGTHFYIGEATDDRHLTIMDSGNVGIGTESPSHELMFGAGDKSIRVGVETTDATDDARLVLMSAASNSPTRGAYIDVHGNEYATNPGNIEMSTGAGGDILFYANPSTSIVERMRILASGNVGIGTTTPQNELNVVGDGNFTGDIYSGGFVNATTDVCIEGGTCLGSIDAGSLGAVTGSGTAMRVPLWNGSTSLNNSNLYQGASGNVGIGTDSPSNALDIRTTEDYIFAGQGAGGKGFVLANNAGYADVVGLSATHGAYNDIDFRTSAVAGQLYLDTSGNVGIGTTSPDSNLQVATQDSIANLKVGSGIANVQLSQTEGTSQAMLGHNVNAAGTSGDFEVDTTHASFGYRGIKFDYSTSAGIQFYATREAVTAGDDISSNAERMRITNAGLVGIGTTSPGRLLDVYNASQDAYIQLQTGKTDGYAGLEIGNDAQWWTAGVNSADDFVIKDGIQFSNNQIFTIENNAPANMLYLDSGGNVGINETTPTAGLHIDVVGAGLKVEAAGVSPYSQNIAEFRYKGNGNSLIIKALSGQAALTTSAGTNLRFSTAGAATQMIINATTGNVGIGTTSPGAKLDIDQDSALIALSVTGGSEGNEIARFTRDVGGNGYVSITASGGDPQLNFNVEDSGTQWSMGVDDALSDIFRIAPSSLISGATNGLVVDSSGDVGIGTTAPTKTLEVQGEINVTTTDADISMFMENGMLVVSG
ncbi:hypothetical protein HOD29_00185, partial [archaeon]|nr:hypothetical protein [archaeon]